MKFDLYKVKLSDYDIKRGLILPGESSEDLAEFIGILTGDGYVSFNTRENKIMISGNFFTDYNYFHEHIHKLVQSLFRLNIRIVRKNNTNGLVGYFRSKAFVSYLQELNYFKLLKNINIPDWIKNNDLYMTAFVRGLFDTDGCVFVSDKKGSPDYPCVELTTICHNLAAIVKEFLVSRKFIVPKIRSYYYSHSINASYKVSLYGWENLSKWIKEIGFSNDYKMNRALKYRK